MKTLILLILAAAPLHGQEKPAQEPARVSRLITVKYLTGPDFDNAIHMMRSFGANVEGRDSMRVIAVSGPSGLVSAVEEAIKRLDTPPPPKPANKNIDVTLHVILASNRPGETKMAPDLDSVLKQMRGLFQYQSYKLLDTQFIRTRDRSQERGENAEYSGMLPDASGEAKYTYLGQMYPSSTEDSRGRTFKLDRFVFQCRPKNNPATTIVNIRTDIDVREGQKVVVGKSNLDSDSTIFLVVSAKQVE